MSPEAVHMTQQLHQEGFEHYSQKMVASASLKVVRGECVIEFIMCDIVLNNICITVEASAVSSDYLLSASETSDDDFLVSIDEDDEYGDNTLMDASLVCEIDSRMRSLTVTRDPSLNTLHSERGVPPEAQRQTSPLNESLRQRSLSGDEDFENFNFSDDSSGEYEEE
jgi:hypothetical protein